MRYLIDSDVLIQAARLHYGFDVVPGFWTWLEEAHAAGFVHSIEQVHTEIGGAGDDLSQWAQDRDSDGFFLAVDATVATAMADVATWATTRVPAYTAAARAEFLAAADFYLVSHAKARGLTVVTAEVAADTVNKIKIPNACAGVGVRCINVYAMLAAEGARFVNG